LEYANYRNIFQQRFEKNFQKKLGQDYIIVIFDRLLDFLEIPLFNLEA
jgi:hypothetical protein